MIKKLYLGDGLYAEFDGYMLKLFTQTGNEVFLEFEVYQALVKFAEQIWGLKNDT